MRDKESSCSCVVLNYNDAETAVRFLEAIRDYKVFSHVIVVDNHSTDSSWELLNEYKRVKNEEIVLLQTERNGGYGYGNNYGIRYAHDVLGDSCALLANPDVVFTESCIRRMLAVLRRHAEAAAISCVQYDIQDRPIREIAWKIPSKFQYAVMSTRIAEKYAATGYSRQYLYAHRVVEVECIPGAMVLFDAGKFVEIGGYDENIFLFCEEATIGWKILHAGYKTLLLSDEHYRHEHSTSINKSIRSKVKQLELIYESRRYFMKTYEKAGPVTLKLAQTLQHRTLQKILDKEGIQ